MTSMGLTPVDAIFLQKGMRVETRTHSLQITMHPRLALSLQSSSCVSPPNSGMVGTSTVPGHKINYDTLLLFSSVLQIDYGSHTC